MMPDITAFIESHRGPLEFITTALQQQTRADLVNVCYMHRSDDTIQIRNTFPNAPAVIQPICDRIGPQAQAAGLHIHRLPLALLDGTGYSVGLSSGEPMGKGYHIGVMVLWHDECDTSAYETLVRGAAETVVTLYKQHQTSYTAQWQTNLLNELGNRATTGDLQEMVGALIETRPFEDELDICCMMRYGPSNHHQIQENFQHVQIVGSWVSGIGYRLGLGTQLTVDLSPEGEIMQAFDQQGALHSEAGHARYFIGDVFLNSLINNKRIRHWHIFPMHITYRRLGAIFISTRNPDGFSLDTLRRYQQAVMLLTGALSVHVLQLENITDNSERQNLLDAVTDGLLILTQHMGQIRVESVNKRFNEMFGCTATPNLSLETLLLAMKLSPEIRNGLDKAFHSTPMASRERINNTFELNAPSGGQPMHIYWESLPINSTHSNGSRRLLMFHDTYPEKSAAQARLLFMQRMSHELFTPLTIIKANADELANETLPTDDVHQRAKDIYTSAAKMQELGRDIERIMTLEMGMTSALVRVWPVNVLLTSVKINYELHGRESGYRVDRHITDEGLEAHLDPSLTQTVLDELLDNAIKFAPKDSTINIYVDKHMPDSAPLPYEPPDMQRPVVVFCMMDEGPGVEEGEIYRVFDLFERGTYAQRQNIIGSGVGLAKCKSMIALQKGHIWAVPSDVTGGGCFYVALPLAAYTDTTSLTAAD